MASARFATAAEVLARYGGASMTTPRVEALLDDASALIRRACNGQILSAFTGRQEEFAADDWNRILFLTQRPVTAVSEVTIDGVAFTDYEWSRWGTLERNDEGAWDEGPIGVTYDGGYAADSDEAAYLKELAIEMVLRAITGDGAPTFDVAAPEAVGWTPHIALRPEERSELTDFGAVPVG